MRIIFLKKGKNTIKLNNQKNGKSSITTVKGKREFLSLLCKICFKIKLLDILSWFYEVYLFSYLKMLKSKK